MPFVPFSESLVEARFVRRPNRFLLQVRLEDTDDVAGAHMADPGRLKELLVPGRRVWIKRASHPRRKTRWTAVLVEAPDGSGLVSVDTTLPNRLVHQALREHAIEELSRWSLVRREVPMGRSRFDFLLEGGESRKMILEVKSVTLVDGAVGFFPDAVTQRGARHLLELAEIAVRPGWVAGVLFVLQRADANEIRAARSVDERFANALEKATDEGVLVFGRTCRVNLDGVGLGAPVPVNVA